MGTSAQAILILDTSVLINFLAIDRAALLSRLATPVLVTNHVVVEVTESYPLQLDRLNSAFQAGYLSKIEVTDIAELQLYANLVSRTTSRKKRLGSGECSAIAVAVHRGFVLGIEDRQAIKQVNALYPQIVILRTQDLIIELIHSAALTVPEADGIKITWASHHRFDLKGIRSFADFA